MDYALVARSEYGSPEVLAEVQLGRSNYSDVVNKLLQSVTVNTKKSYSYEAKTINFVVSAGTVFLCVANGGFPTRVCFAFLDKLEKEFDGRPDFETRMRKWITFFNEDSGADKLRSVQSALDDVKDVMVENIETVLRRGEKMEDLMATTEQMEMDATSFVKGSKRLSKKMWFRSMWLTIIIIIIIVVAIITACFFLLIFILLACGMLTGFSNCGGSGGDAPSA